MYETLESFLISQIGETGTALIVEGFELIESHGCEDHHFPINNIMGTLDQRENFDNVDMIRNILKENSLLVLKEMGIELKEESLPVDVTNAFLFSTGVLPEFEDKKQLQAIVDDGNSPEEILSEITEFITGFSWVESIEWIQSVSNDLIDRIKDLIQTPVSQMSSNVTPNKEAIERCKKYFSVITETHVRGLIKLGYSVGSPYSLFSAALREHWSLTDPMAEEFAKEILGAALASDVKEDVLSFAKQATNEFVTDIGLITKVNALMDRYHREVFGA